MSASLTWPTILSRSRPPPRGPLRSSAGARRGDLVEDRPGGLDQVGQPGGLGAVERPTVVVGDRGSGRRSRCPPPPACARRRRVGAFARAAWPARPATGRVAVRIGRERLERRDPPSCRTATSPASRARWRRPSSASTRSRRRCVPSSGGRILPVSRTSRARPVDVAAVRGRARRRAPRRRSRRRRRPGAIARTWAGRLTPNPTATGTGETARRRGRAGRPSRAAPTARRSRRRARRSTGSRRFARRSRGDAPARVVGATR